MNRLNQIIEDPTTYAYKLATRETESSKKIKLMDKIQTTDCYLPVDVNKRLPTKIGWYYTIENGEQEMGYFYGDQFAEAYRLTIWLEKKEGVIVLTPAEFEKEVSERVQSALSLLNVKPQALPNI